MRSRSALIVGLGWVLLEVSVGHATDGNDTDADEPMPVSVKTDPTSVWKATAVVLSGLSVNDGRGSPVTLKIHVPAGQGKAAALVTIRAELDAEGRFSERFTGTTTVGTYDVEAVAPDRRGTARSRFRVTDAGTMDVEAGSALTAAAEDVGEIVDLLDAKLSDLPSSPAKDEILQKLVSLRDRLAQIKQQTPEVIRGINLIVDLGEIAQYPNQDRRNQLARAMEGLRNAHADARTLIAQLKPKRTGCDDLEVIVEGFKFASFLFNLVAAPGEIAKNYLNDVIGYVTGKVTEGAGESASFGSSEAGKNAPALIKAYHEIPVRRRLYKVMEAYKGLASSSGGIASDAGAFAAGKTFSAYCEQFTGPVTAHMKAQFFNDGEKWWEYEFDLSGTITVHYPKSASGTAIPVKGRIEGNAKNFKVWENSLQVMYPKLMTSAFVKKVVIPVQDMSELDGQIRNVEGSVVGAHLPSAFFFDCSGVVTKDRIDLIVGAPRTDINAAATVVAFSASVLSLSIIAYTYRLPYKDAHFIFDRTASTFDIPLSTQGKVVRGKRHFENSKGTAAAKGQYSVDIEMCNPSCS